jgi:hypothetical protein
LFFLYYKFQLRSIVDEDFLLVEKVMQQKSKSDDPVLLVTIVIIVEVLRLMMYDVGVP